MLYKNTHFSSFDDKSAYIENVFLDKKVQNAQEMYKITLVFVANRYKFSYTIF